MIRGMSAGALLLALIALVLGAGVGYLLGRGAGARTVQPPAAPLNTAELEQRLRWGGVLQPDALPVRVFANRSIVHPDLVRRDSLAAVEQAEKLEAAIAGGQRVLLERFSDAAEHGEEPRDAIRVWPLQLLFHNIGWYLAYEADAVGHDHGLIRTERLDRLALRQVDAGFRRSPEQRACAVASSFAMIGQRV